MADEEVTLRYVLKIEAGYELSGDYMGGDSSMKEFLRHARDDASNMKVLIQRGAGEPELVRAKIDVDHVVVMPKKK